MITDDKVAREITQSLDFDDELQTEFAIHKISSSSNYDFEPQDLIDNLDMVEVPIFEHFNINIEALVETVFHYGLDYAESGEDEESGAKRRILSTPFIWHCLENYHGNKIATEKENKLDIINLEWKDIINKGESNSIEFKPCLIYNFKTNAAGISVKYIIAKAICGFLNSNGGVLFIGVTDNGEIQGLNDFDYSLFDGKNGQDKILLELDSLISYFFNLSVKPLINSSIEKIEGKDILVIGVTECSKPVFLRNKRYDEIKKEFYIRMNASTRQITDIEEIIEYITNKENPAGNNG